MKAIKGLLLIGLVSLGVISCKKDEEKNPSDYAFSKETVSANKTKLEDAGQQMITEMKGMENAEAGPVLESFDEFTSTNDPFGSSLTKSAPVFRTLSAASSFTSAKNSFSYLTQIMKADALEDPSTLQEVYDQHKGVYTWNSTSQVWDKTTSSELKFLFPSTKEGKSNDASMVITYTGKTGTTILSNYNGDLPATFNTSVSVGSKKVAEVDLKASYNNDGIPTSVNYYIALFPYKYEVTWTYSSSSLSLRYHLTNDNKNIMDCFGKLNGNFSSDNIKNVNNDRDSDPTDLVSNGNSYFQVFNIKLAGDIDYKGLSAAEQKIESQNLDELASYTALAAEINKYMNLDLVFADSKQKIASVQAYPVMKTEEYYDWYGNKHTNEKAEIEMKLIFSENESPTSLETYFNTGFQDFINDLNSFIVELNNDYELGIDPVEY